MTINHFTEISKMVLFQPTAVLKCLTDRFDSAALTASTVQFQNIYRFSCSLSQNAQWNIVKHFVLEPQYLILRTLKQ